MCKNSVELIESPAVSAQQKLNKLEIFRLAVFIVCLFVLNFVVRLAWSTHVQSEITPPKKKSISALSLGS